VTGFGRFMSMLAALGVVAAAVAAGIALGDITLTPLTRTFLALVVAAWVLVGLARQMGIYPNQPLVLFALLPALVTLGLLTTTWAIWPALALDVLVVAVALADLLTLPARASFGVERHAGRTLSLNQTHRVTLTIVNRGERDYVVRARDGVPQELHPEPDEFRLPLAARSRATVHYELRSSRRGAFQLTSVFLRVRSRLALWQRFMDYPARTELHVYPDMRQLAEYALLARKNRLSLLGLRRTRRIGQDNEFERLRDYTLDDNYKFIDWRATARRDKLTVRDFQQNQSQRLIFLIDCGRMMTNQAAGLSLLDHAFNSMLMLSYVALAHGDAVGMLTFSDEIHEFVPPKAGMKQMNRLLHASFDRFPRLVESRYDDAFLYLAANHRKRSLVVLMTNLVDEVNSNQVERYLTTLVGKHLPLGVLLRDRRVFEAAERREPGDAALFRAGAAAEILTWRRQVLADLRGKGVLSVDVFPEELTAPLVNSYLEIKARHLL
jgi:uncharacterized protein (DUF58 family)